MFSWHCSSNDCCFSTFSKNVGSEWAKIFSKNNAYKGRSTTAISAQIDLWLSKTYCSVQLFYNYWRYEFNRKLLVNRKWLLDYSVNSHSNLIPICFVNNQKVFVFWFVEELRNFPYFIVIIEKSTLNSELFGLTGTARKIGIWSKSPLNVLMHFNFFTTNDTIYNFT